MSDPGRSLDPEVTPVGTFHVSPGQLANFLRTGVRKKFTRTGAGDWRTGAVISHPCNTHVFWVSMAGVRSALVDELLDDEGNPRPVARDLMHLLDRLGVDELRERQRMSDLDILTMGITFTVYSTAGASTGRGRSTSSPG